MANALYSKGKEAFLSGSINLSSDTIKVVLVDSAEYTLAISTDDNLDDIPSGARVGTSSALASKTVTNGTFDAADVSITGISDSSVFEYIIIFKDSGVESTSKLIACFDTGTGWPASVSNSGQVDITWHASGIFSL